MSFESRTLHGDSDNLKVDVLAEGTKFSMISITYKPSNEYIDGEGWIKWKLYPALWAWLNHSCDERHTAILEESLIPSKYYLELYELLCKAEALGWMSHIKYEK